MSVELAILKFINLSLANSTLDIFFKVICNFDIWRWPVLVIVGLLLWKGGPKGRLLVALALVTALISDSGNHLILKPFFARLRPCHSPELEWVRVIDGCGGKYGFPSSHAVNFFGQAMVAGLFYPRTRYYLYPLAALVAIGRVYLGVHYPLDVLAGAALGMAVGFAAVAAAKQFAPPRVSVYLPTRKIITEKIRNPES